MRTRSNSTIEAILESARRTSRRLSLGPLINNRSEATDLENQTETTQVNLELLQIRKECGKRERRRKKRNIIRTKSLSVSSYHNPTDETIPHEAMGAAVVLIFIAFVITCLYFAEFEIATYEDSDKTETSSESTQ